MRRQHHALRPESQLSIPQERLPPLGKVLDEALTPHSQARFPTRVAGEVLEFVWIPLEIKKLLLAVARVENVLRTAVGEGIPMVLGAIGNVVFEVDELGPAGA